MKTSLFSVLPYLTPIMQDEVIQAIEQIQNDELQATLALLSEQYMAMIAQDYSSLDEYLRDMSLCLQFEASELDRCWYIHHDPHAEMMADLP
jgi:hypothetical protein